MLMKLMYMFLFEACVAFSALLKSCKAFFSSLVMLDLSGILQDFKMLLTERRIVSFAD